MMMLAVWSPCLLSLSMAVSSVAAMGYGPWPIAAPVDMPTTRPFPREESHNSNSNINSGGGVDATGSVPISLDEKHYAETAPRTSTSTSSSSHNTCDITDAAATCSVTITPELITSLEIRMPLAQSLRLEKYQANEPSIDVHGSHAGVATHSGYIIFYEWINDYPTNFNAQDVDGDISEIRPGYWKRNTVFYMEEEDDTDATIVIHGNIAAVGMPDVHTRYGRYAGIVYLYEYDEGSNGWLAHERPLTPHYFPNTFGEQAMKYRINNQRNHAFGSSLYLQGDILVVGAPGVENFVGAIYVFERHATLDDSVGTDGYHWVQTQQYTPPNLDVMCPGAVFGGGMQMYKNYIAVGADCRHWMFLYQYNPINNRLVPVQDEETFARQNSKQLMGTVVVSEEYFAYSVLGQGVYIYEKKEENKNASSVAPFRLMQFIDGAPFDDVMFGAHMVINEDGNILIIAGDYRIFFFAIKNNDNTNNRSNSNNADSWELVLVFELPHTERGIALSKGQLVLGGPENAYSMNLKELLESISIERGSRKSSSDHADSEEYDDVIEVEISPFGPI